MLEFPVILILSFFLNYRAPSALCADELAPYEPVVVVLGVAPGLVGEGGGEGDVLAEGHA